MSFFFLFLLAETICLKSWEKEGGLTAENKLTLKQR